MPCSPRRPTPPSVRTAAHAAWLFAIVLLGTPWRAAATDPSDLCTGFPTCNVTAPVTVTAGSVLDFPPGTALVFKAAGDLSLAAGPGGRTMLIRAASVTFEPGAKIFAGESVSTTAAVVTIEATAGDVVLQRAGTTKSEIDLVNNLAGDLNLLASGSVVVDGVIDAHATGDDGSGGTIVIQAGSGTVSVTQDVDLHGTPPDGGGGGFIVSAAGDVTIAGVVDTTGNGFGGGDINVTSVGGNVTVLARLDARDPRYADGGDVDLFAGAGNVTIDAPVNASGGSTGSGDAATCGSGGDLTITAGGTITLNDDVSLNADGPDCAGGDLLASAGASFVQAPGTTIDLGAAGSNGTGGSFSLFSGGTADLRAIDAGAADAGDVDAVASGALTVASRLDAQSTTPSGNGGSIHLRGCDVHVTATGTLDSRGALSVLGNVIESSGQITVAGTMNSADANRLVYLAAAPITTGGTFSPPRIEQQDGSLPPCADLSNCGNGVHDGAEVCDDGGHVACDGCAPDCARIDDVCGDGVRECGEECDDGNTTSGDGCETDCTLPPTSFLSKPGSPRSTVGCLAEWKLFTTSPNVDSRSGFPTETQQCTDGDPGCDADRANDGRCTFHLQICLRAEDVRLPACTPAPLDYVRIGSPDPTDTGSANYANAIAIRDALVALGIEVRHGTTVLADGPPDGTFDHCTATFPITFTHTPGRIARRNFGITAKDIGSLTMKSNPLELDCRPNSSTCGNGVQESFETCDDGNVTACDGCSAICQSEVCGNGIVECGEECDLGAANGMLGSACNATCGVAPPALRIPAGNGSRDCTSEWAMTIDPSHVVVDKHGVPKNAQACTDGDPTCDADPTAGTCRVALWQCFGGADARIACGATGVTSVLVQKPKTTATGTQLAARTALLAAEGALGFPVGPSETCTRRLYVDVPVGGSGLKLGTRATRADGKRDSDTLRIKCVAP